MNRQEGNGNKQFLLGQRSGASIGTFGTKISGQNSLNPGEASVPLRWFGLRLGAG